MEKNWIIFFLISFELCFAYWDNKEKVYVRKNAKDMTLKEWESLRSGIREMKYRSQYNEFNPTGYYYQANTHGWVGFNSTPDSIAMAKKYNWHQCQHGQYFFLPWHRMYLFYFEKILRSAANDPNLTIPYWDYFDPEQRSIPYPFRIPPNSKSNPLYVNERCSQMNQGKSLATEIYNHDPALSSTFFTVNKIANAQLVCSSFGSAETDEPMFSSDGHGILEQIPHNQIHLFVGGPKGFMSDNCKAAQDPIFWIHHAQIDRIWETWLKEGGKNVDENKWLDQSFDWFDENGDRKSHKVKDVMDTVKQLNYKYDKLIDRSTKKEPKIASTSKTTIIAEENDKEKLYVKYTKRSILLSLNKEGQHLLHKLSKDSNDENEIEISIHLNIDYIRRGFIFDMFLNLPNETYPYESPPNFVRPIVVLQPDCDKAPQEGKSLHIKNCYDVTTNLKLILKQEANFGLDTIKSGILNITFVPSSCGIIIDSIIGDWIKFNRIQVVHLIQKYEPSSSFFLKSILWFYALFLERIFYFSIGKL